MIRLLNTSENLFSGDDTQLDFTEIDSIKNSFIIKIVDKLDGDESKLEEQLNSCSILSELAETKSLFNEMISRRCLDKYRDYLNSEFTSSKWLKYKNTH